MQIFFNDALISNNVLYFQASQSLKNQAASGEGTWFIENTIVA